jgi:hypothetical protein
MMVVQLFKLAHVLKLAHVRPAGTRRCKRSPPVPCSASTDPTGASCAATVRSDAHTEALSFTLLVSLQPPPIALIP